MAFKVLSYNILPGGQGRLDMIAQLIQSRQPHAAALLEATNRANVEHLAHDLGMHLVYGVANSAFAIAWLSRLPIRRSENHRLDVLAKTLLEIEVAWGGAALRLYATHLASRHDAHFPEEEVVAILEALRPFAGQPHLLVGDLNALRPGDPLGAPPAGVEMRGDALPGAPRRAIQRILNAAYVDCYRRLHPQAPGYTYPADAPWLRLDYIFASPSMATHLSTCGVIAEPAAERASDHLPVWAEFGA